MVWELDSEKQKQSESTAKINSKMVKQADSANVCISISISRPLLVGAEALSGPEELRSEELLSSEAENSFSVLTVQNTEAWTCSPT